MSLLKRKPQSGPLTRGNKITIAKLSSKMLASDIAAKIGVSALMVRRYQTLNNLRLGRPEMIALRSKKLHRPFTAKEDKTIIADLPTSNIKAISKKLGRTSSYVSKRAKELGLEALIQQKALDSRIKPGHVPLNKGRKQAEYMSRAAIRRTAATRFKKGNVPHNTKEKDGTITIRHDHKTRGGKAYKYIRISLGNWKPLHTHIWEKKYGPVPKGKCLWFIDGNTMNCKLSNLELITRADNARRNRADFLSMPPQLQTTKKLINQLKKAIYATKK